MQHIQENYLSLLKNAQKLNPHARIIAVTKNQPIENILEVIKGGAKIIGENRIQEAEVKFPYFPSSVEKHLIGQLQSNKVKKAVKLFNVIETVDSYKLAEKINRIAGEKRIKMRIFIQVNTSGEIQKNGIKPSNLLDLIQKCANLDYLKIEGLMTIAKFSDNPEECRESFILLKKLFQQAQKLDFSNLKLKHLSMGMTNDYQVALEEGSTLVRIGTGIFGKKG